MKADFRPSSLFLGTPDFALPSLEAAIATTQVLGVVTQPDRRRGRGLEVQPCPVKKRALEVGLPVFSPASLRKPSDELARLEAFLSGLPARPDFLLVTAYGNLLPQAYLDLPRRGPINVHASLLPRWRGAAPIQRALEAGDEITGVCLQRMVMELDAGDILAEEQISVDPDLRSSTAFSELSRIGGQLLRRFLSSAPERLEGRPQAASEVTLAPKIRKEEGYLSCDWSLRDLHNRIRAFDPWPGVKARLPGGEELRLVETSRVGPFKTGSAPGRLYLIREHEDIYAESADGRLRLLRVQFPSKPVQPASVALRNHFDRSRGAPLELQPFA